MLVAYVYTAEHMLGAGEMAPWDKGADCHGSWCVSCNPSIHRVEGDTSHKWSSGLHMASTTHIYKHAHTHTYINKQTQWHMYMCIHIYK